MQIVGNPRGGGASVISLWWQQRSESPSWPSPAAHQAGIALACIVGSLTALGLGGCGSTVAPTVSPSSTTAAPTSTTSALAAPIAPPIVTSPAGLPAVSVPVERAPAPVARPSAAPAVQAAPAPAPAAGSLVAPAPAPPARATSGACTASPRYPTPGDGGDETITVHTTAGATVSLKVHYKTTTHPFSGVADGTGTASITFSIGRPTPGYPVRVDVSTSSGQVCSTLFTPQ